MLIEKYSFGTGDRFGKEGQAQLKAIQEIKKLPCFLVFYDHVFCAFCFACSAAAC